MSARPIGEIAQEIVDKIAEISGFSGVNQFTMTSDSAMEKGGPEECVNTQPALTCNANTERRS